MRRSIFTGALVVALLSVGHAVSAQGNEKDGVRIPLKELMAHVMQRNAGQLWRWTAYLIDETGEHSGRPKTDEEWEDAESDSLTLEQLSYLLDSPPYRVETEEWGRHLAAFRATARASADAAERKDYDALEKAGNDLNDQCVSCHLTFAPELEAQPPES